MPNMKLVETKTINSDTASIIFSNIPQTYTDLKLFISSKSSENGQSTNYWIQFNSDTGANYTNKRIYSGSTTIASDNGNTSLNGISAGFIPGDIANTTSTFSNCEIYIPNYAGSSTKSVSCDSSSEANTGSGVFLATVAGLWNNTAAITTLTVVVSSVQQKTNSTFYLYGISNTVSSGAKAYGGYVTEDNNYFYHTFLSSGTFTPTQNITTDYLVIAGGGAGGPAYYGGGGGAGGLRSTVTATGGGGSLESALSLTANTNYTVTVGAGGAGGTDSYTSRGASGNNSVFSTITSTGGGGGGTFYTAVQMNGGDGGSSGGGGNGIGTAGTRTSSPIQGNNGGNASTVLNTYAAGGGGGGAGTAGANSTTSPQAAGNGGNGVQITALATSTLTGANNGYYAGGGGGGFGRDSGALGGTAGTGGLGGGADGSTNGFPGYSAIINTGGGGGGAGGYSNKNGSGGSGLVIVRYAK